MGLAGGLYWSFTGRSGLAELLCCQLKLAKLTVCSSGRCGESLSAGTEASLAVTGVSGREGTGAEAFFLLGSPGVMSTLSMADILDMLLMFDRSDCWVSLELSLRTGEAA